MSKPVQCALCERNVAFLTRHHLIPRTRHRNKKNKKLFDREKVHEVIWICRACHDNVHAVLTEKELERNYSTLELLAAHPEVKKFTDWIRNKPETAGVRVKTSRRLG
jgi:Fe-S oxidoreductase